MVRLPPPRSRRLVAPRGGIVKQAAGARKPMGRMDGVSAEVCCTARLHLGFLDLTGGPGRRFGGLGMSLDGPLTRLAVRRDTRDRADGPERGRALALLRAWTEAHGIAGGHALTVHEAVPAHAGLGSGTQLALAVGAALRALHGWPADPRGDAATLGRGGRSGVGIATFQHGGLVLDGGVGPDGLVPPLLGRCAVPAEWRAVLVGDPQAAGLSGGGERAGFAALPPMTEAQSGALCRLAVMQAMPAAAEDDLPAFGDAVTRMQALLGEYFAPAQGGTFTSPLVEAAMAVLRGAGAVGIGQSSWGPTGFAFLRGDAAAGAAVAQARAACPGLDFGIHRALNRGAVCNATA
jgi:beta-RFAP synthase